jgi:hypothetical protein
VSSRSAKARGWNELLGAARGVFGAAGFSIFETLVCGWVLAPGRRTITAMICVADPVGRRAHDAYHRFVRCGRWSIDELWRVLVVRLVDSFCAQGVVPLDLDDTLYKKTGRSIEGAGIFRDAVHSTKNRVVHAWGLNLVVCTLRVSAPWGRCPIALPVAVRLHKKGGPTTVELACQMMDQLAGWLPGRCFSLCADGAYATLIGKKLPRTVVTSRLRRDAALFEPAPPPTGRRGRPRTKGARLETPTQMSERLEDSAFAQVDYDCRGKTVTALVWSTIALWYSVDQKRMLAVVIVRDPDGAYPDDFFVTDDLEASDDEIAARYAGRWAIEICFREVKQGLHAEDPQSWRGEGPERAAALSLWIYSAIWAWYLPTFGTAKTWITRPWYKRKAVPSFLDALATLRRELWAERITSLSSSEADNPEIINGLLDVLSRAA